MSDLNPEHPDVVCVYETDDVNLVPILKSILEDAEIPYFVQGDEAVSLFPVGSFGTHGAHHGLMSVSIHVGSNHEDEARALLTAVPTAERTTGTDDGRKEES